MTYNQHNEKFGFDLRRNPYVRRRVNIATVICCVCAFGVLSFYLYMSLAETDVFLRRLNYSIQGSTSKSILLFVICTQAFWFSAAWVLPVSTLVLLCLDIRNAFQKFTADLQNEVNDSATFDLEHFRQRHQGLSRVVEQIDAIYVVVTLNVYLTSIPITCLLIYVFVMAGSDSYKMVTESLLVFISCLGEMVIVTAAATALNTAVNY